jgi:hypothetical protein
MVQYTAANTFSARIHEQKIYYAGFEVLTAASMKMDVFWVVGMISP